MVKHYVGARYVPKFASPVEWTADTSYEALTIVTFNNASYTSKVQVPPTVGNPANNPQYWALTGNYNAQVEQYRQETETANNILQGNINSEAATRATQDELLQTQIDQIIAPSGEAPSAAEVENARIGADGVTYPTLGDAIRTQNSYKADKAYGGSAVGIVLALTAGYSWGTNANYYTANNRARSDMITVTPDMVSLSTTSGYLLYVFGNNTGVNGVKTAVSSGWSTSFDIADTNYVYLFVNVRREDNGDITSDNLNSVLSVSKYQTVLPYATKEYTDGVDKILLNNINNIEKTIYKEQTLVGLASVSPSSNFSKTRRWFYNGTISGGTLIKSFSFYATSSTLPVTIEVWKLVNSTLTLYATYTVTPSAVGKTTVVFNLYAQGTTYISWKNDQGNNVGCSSNNDYQVLMTSDMSSTSLALSSLETFNNLAPHISIDCDVYDLYDVQTLPENVLLIGEGQRYEQIQEALIAITDDSVSKPYTLLILPSGTPYEPFSMIRDAWTDSYPWSNISPRYISIIGLDKAHCVIRSDSGNYKLPCGEPMTNGIIKNLTFVMTNDDQDASATQGGYCIHIDCRTKNDVGYNMTIEDCNFMCASGPCLGIGMHKNCTLTVRRCNLKTTLSANYNPHEGYRNLYDFGVVFCHSSSLADSTNQRINIEDCFGVCAEGNKSLWLATAGNYSPITASFYYRLLRNVFWNETQNAPAYSISGTLTAESMNFGNNIQT